MPLVTLTTDLGTKDFYTGVLKGAILQIAPEVSIVDITHSIPSYDYIKAAFVVRSFYPFYPAGSIHIIGVSSAYKHESRLLLTTYANQHFLFQDNGIFSLLFEEKPTSVIHLREELFTTRKMKNMLGQAAGMLCKGLIPEDLGDVVTNPIEKSQFVAVTQGDSIRGIAFYIDSFGNVFTNITKALFESFGQGRPFVIMFRQMYEDSVIYDNYHDVVDGEKLAMFTSSGFLKIAINKGNASRLLGISIGDSVQVVFGR